ncbi:MAG: 6-carboxyhexanoate--CoA ligase [Nitrospirae bacterium]|nr:6-carboxyhexanoate--CoA ligase [Nitrospirota bacterium]
MEQYNLYSIRMRASVGNKHVSGAERIISSEKLDAAVQTLVTRARNKNFTPEQIVITIDRLENIPFTTLTALDLVTIKTPDMTAGRSVAFRILQSLDISEPAAMAAINHLCNGATPHGNSMRGAMIIDMRTGERLEPDHERGVRASRFDWTDEALVTITRKLAAIGLTHFRTHEALALATKVAYAPGMVAELCWSDDPDYTAGYVASRSIGYVRFPMLKLPGDMNGGRVFFVDRNTLDLDAFIRYLQAEAVLIADSGECRPAIEPADYFKKYR